MISPLDESSLRSTVEVAKIVGLHDEPDSFDGVEVRRIGREIQRFKEMPVETLPLMPGSIIEDKDVPFSRGSYGFCCFSKKDLKDIGIAMTCFNGKELSRTRTDRTQYA